MHPPSHQQRHQLLRQVRPTSEQPTKPPKLLPPTAAPTPTPTGTVRGTIFDDANNNGKQDPGEQGIPNVDVVITDKNGDTQTVTTNSNGEYSATVPAGSTEIDIVESTLPPGGVQTVGTDPTTVNVPAGGVATDLDGFYFPTDAPTKSPTAKPSPAPSSSPSESPSDSPTAAPTPTPTGTVRGTIFDDANNNGKQDPGEQGIPNVDVVITDKNGDTQTVTTNSNGEYSATVPAGSTEINIVESTLPPGGVQTVGTDPTTVNVPAGGVATDLDGFYFPTDAPTKSPTKAPTPAPTLRPTKCQNQRSLATHSSNSSTYPNADWYR